MFYTKTLAMIGNTPMVEATCFDVGVCRLFLKLEQYNPGGSIKDRIGLSMIEAAERDGKIKPGDTLIEATAGNTGLGLALVAAQKGYRLLLVIPDKMSTEKVMHLKALGAEIVMTRSDVEKGHPEYYQDYARRLAAETPNAYYIDQFNNPANPLAHESSTGPEIWHQTAHAVDAVVVGIGSGGTIAGLTHFFQRVKPSLEIVLADPAGSILADYVKTKKIGKAGSWLVEGIGEDFVPAQADLSLVRRAFTVDDEESFSTARTLLRKEGILAGSSSGTLIAAAVRFAKEQKTPKTIVTFVCDSGNKYLSKMYNDYWMQDHGFLRRKTYGDLRDIIARLNDTHTVITVKPEDTLLTAYSRMRSHDVSQLPVMRDETIAGIIDESDILMSLTSNGEGALRTTVANVMTTNLETVSPDQPLSAVVDLLKKGFVAIVSDTNSFYGLITRVDVINHLRKMFM